jgi:DNA-binding transcriptional regulator YdaS (Cro superfamily)
MSETAALERAVAIVGSQSALARKLGLKQAHIWNWLNKTKRVPGEAVLGIEAATDGKVTRTELRPDLYPPEAA